MRFTVKRTKSKQPNLYTAPDPPTPQNTPTRFWRHAPCTQPTTYYAKLVKINNKCLPGP